MSEVEAAELLGKLAVLLQRDERVITVHPAIEEDSHRVTGVHVTTATDIYLVTITPVP